MAATPVATNFGEAVLPSSAWKLLQTAAGIKVGGTIGSATNIQVIFDPNCPYCARLYLKLKQQYPNIAVRWVPIAYLVASSSSRGAAILQSKNPATNLDTDFVHYVYDYKHSHGGYQVPRESNLALPHANVDLKKYWLQWGGATPMIVFRNSTGEVVRAMGAGDDVLRQVMQQVRKNRRAMQTFE